MHFSHVAEVTKEGVGFIGFLVNDNLDFQTVLFRFDISEDLEQAALATVVNTNDGNDEDICFHLKHKYAID